MCDSRWRATWCTTLGLANAQRIPKVSRRISRGRFWPKAKCPADFGFSFCARGTKSEASKKTHFRTGRCAGLAVRGTGPRAPFASSSHLGREGCARLIPIPVRQSRSKGRVPSLTKRHGVLFGTRAFAPENVDVPPTRGYGWHHWTGCASFRALVVLV